MKGADQHLHFECRTSSNLGIGLIGRISPNNVVLTKFYSQDESKPNQGRTPLRFAVRMGNARIYAQFSSIRAMCFVVPMAA